MVCLPCKRGTAQNKTGQRMCNVCNRDWWAGDSGWKRCKWCPQGYSTNEETKMTWCVPCAVGMFNDARHEPCKPCHSPYYQDQRNATSCKLCPLGYQASYEGVPNSRCIECSVGKYADRPGFCVPCRGKTNYTKRTGRQMCSVCPFPLVSIVGVSGNTGCANPNHTTADDCPDDFYLDDKPEKPSDWRCQHCPHGASCVGPVNFSGVVANLGLRGAPPTLRNSHVVPSPEHVWVDQTWR